MGHPRRGYVLIAVLAALGLCVSVVGAYASASRRAMVQAGAEISRAQASYAARGAAVQAMKDLATRLGVAPTSSSGGSYLAAEPGQKVEIPGLPAFPPEVARAGGFLGEIAKRLEDIRRRQEEDQRKREGSNRGGSVGGGSSAGGSASDAAQAREKALRDAEPPPMPLSPVGAAEIPLGAVRSSVLLECETGKLNVNQTSRRRLHALLVATGSSADAADVLLDALEDRRISRSPVGSVDRRVTPQRQRDQPQKGRRLDRLEELLDVPGFTPEMYERLTQHLTVHGGSVVDPNYATREVFMALGVRDERVLRSLRAAQLRLERLERDRLRDIVGAAAFTLMEDAVAYRLRPVFTVRATAEVDGAVGRYLLRVDFSAETGLLQVVESREGWL